MQHETRPFCPFSFSLSPSSLSSLQFFVLEAKDNGETAQQQSKYHARNGK